MGREIPDLISVSIVSHGHAELAAQLFDDLRVQKSTGIEVILTLNIEEALPFDPDAFPFSVKTIRNASPASERERAREQGGRKCFLSMTSGPRRSLASTCIR